MGLYARITAPSRPEKILVHRCGAALRHWAAGPSTRLRSSAVKSPELDALRASYDAMGTGNATAAFNKAIWLYRMEDVFLLCETGDYTESKAKTALGF